jgi:hypothetical protein
MAVGSESMIERLTDAIQARAQDGADSPVDRGDAEYLARAALQALMTPTPAMIEAGQKCEGFGGDGGQIYTAMIRSAMEGE